MKKQFLCLAALLFLLSSFCLGDINYDQPASFLVFPIIRSVPGGITLITVTNVNLCYEIIPGSNFYYGDVVAHFYYVDGDNCDVTDRREFLSPGDTFMVPADTHAPTISDGWMYVVAENPSTWNPIRFDGFFQAAGSGNIYDSGLIGKAQIVNGVSTYLYSLSAIGIQARSFLSWGVNLDLDSNGELEFGPELTSMPKALYISDFTEIDFLNADTHLALLAFQPNEVRIDMGYKFWDNEEDSFYRSDSFHCWMYKSLLSITASAGNLNGEPAFLPTGWVKMWVYDGYNTNTGQTVPADEIPILGAVVYTIARPLFTTADLLHHSDDSFYGGSVEY